MKRKSTTINEVNKKYRDRAAERRTKGESLRSGGLDYSSLDRARTEMGQRVLNIINKRTKSVVIEPIHGDGRVLKEVIEAIRSRGQKKEMEVETVEIAEIAEEDIFAEAGVDYRATEGEELPAPYPASDSEDQGVTAPYPISNSDTEEVTAPYPVSESDSEPEDIDLFASARTRFKEETTELLQQQPQQKKKPDKKKQQHDNTWQKTRHIMQTKYNIDINQT